MNPILQVAVVLALFVGAAFLLVHTRMAAKKSRVETGLQIQCSSGDSEVMSFNVNFHEGESLESKSSKIDEAFQFIQDRRDHNHEAWLEKKAHAVEKNSKLTPDELKMRRLSERREAEAASGQDGEVG